jgi:uncharacterized protein with FMN-binding domain
MKNRPLIALSSAAIVAVYTAGYMRTRAAAERFDEPTEPGRPSRPPTPGAPDAPHVEGRLTIHAPSAAPAVVPRSPIASSTAAAPSAARDAETPSAAPVETPSVPPGDAPATPGFDAQSIQGLAQPTIDAPPPEPPAVARGQYKDGSYTGWGYCRHGDLQASVVIESGRIVSAKVVQCLTRYSCNWIEPLYPQVVQRQNAEVDYISGASESSDAYHDAISEALAKAK